MRVAVATRNVGKLRELQVALAELELVPVDTAGIGEEPGETFLENARFKAQFARSRAPAGAWALGEDSGLCVDGLAGAPGVRSARLAGVDATDAENVEALLAALRGAEGPSRRAHFVCELVLLDPDGHELRASGTLAGAIVTEPHGEGGFGYDPVFAPDAAPGRTVAELGGSWKATHSHRAQAARRLTAALAHRRSGGEG